MPDSPTVADAAPDAPADAAPAVTPWTIPTGPALAGVTLADGWTDLRELPAPLAIGGGWTDSLMATTDGRHLLFAYSQVDFSTFFISNGASQPVTGPVLAGLSSPTFTIFEADLGTYNWTIAPHPIDAQLAGRVVASAGTNIAGDLLVFSDFSGAHTQLFYAQRSGTTWSAPAALDINSASCNDDNAKLLGDLATGVTIVWESNRTAGSACGQRTIYTATYAAGAFSPATSLGVAEGTTSDDSQPWLSPDAKTLLFTSVRSAGYGVYAATRASATAAFAGVHPIALATTAQPLAGKVVLIGQATIVAQPEGELLFMMCAVAENRANGMTYGDADHIRIVPCVARRPH